MAIYRADRGRRVVIAAAVAFVAGLVLGGVGGRLTSPGLADHVDAIRTQVAPIVSSLDVIRLEYPKLLAGGEDGGGAEAAAIRIRETFEAARPTLEILNPAGSDALDASIAALVAAIDARAPDAEIGAVIDAVETAVDAALGR